MGTLTGAEAARGLHGPRSQPVSLAQAATVLVAGLVFTFAGWFLGRIYVDSELKDRRQELADAVRNSIETRILVYTEALLGVQSLFSASDEVTRLEFHRYVARLRGAGQYEGMQAVSFNRYVRAADREALERRVRADTSMSPEGNPSFSVHPRTDKPFSLVVDYLEPFEGNETAFGFDVASDESRLRAALRARDTGRPQATAPIELVQETGSQMSILYFLPVHAAGTSTHQPERSGAFQGLVTGVMRMDDLLHGSLDPRDLAACDFELEDAGPVEPGWAPEMEGSITLFSNHRPGQRDQGEARGASVQVPPIEVGGRTWRLVFHRLTIQTPVALRGLPAVILAVGSVISSLAAVIVFILGSRARLAEDLRSTRDRLSAAASVFSCCSEGVLITDRDGNIVAANEAFLDNTGYSEQELIGENPRILQSKWHSATDFDRMWQTLLETGRWQGEIWDRRKDGGLLVQWLTISAAHDSSGNVTHFVGISSDITHRKESERRLQYLSTHDPLTALANRALLMDQLRHGVSEAAQAGKLLAVMLLDLDNFKPINDTWGHLVGDKLLQQTAQRLRLLVRQGDTVARLGGDEFVVLLTGNTELGPISAFAQELFGSLSKPFEVEGHRIQINASIGVSVYPLCNEDPEALIRRADAAMYEAKRTGLGGFVVFEPAVGVRLARAASEADTAWLEQGRPELYYQPWVNSETGRVEGVEALLRWQLPTMAALRPEAFLSWLVKTRRVGQIATWALRTASRQAVEWRRNHPGLLLGVNVFSEQLGDSFASEVLQAIEESGLPADSLQLEFRERDLLRDADHQVLRRLRELGIRVCVDDIGTELASVESLKDWSFDAVKVVGSLVRRAGIEREDTEFVSQIIARARELVPIVIAQGVETEAHLRHVRAAGCHAHQGFVVSKPQAAPDLEVFLAAHAQTAGRSDGLSQAG